LSGFATKILVGYDTKYGNIKIVAQKIQEGLTKIEGIKTELYNIKEIDTDLLNDYDAIVLGAPNHMGRPTRTMKNFVNKLAQSDLKLKKAAIFGTYAGKERTEDRAVRKLEKFVKKKFPSLNIIQPTLSIRVKRIHGPIIKGELPKSINFGEKIGFQFIEK
jgi:menaquinone-dependent protoporphyrinogen IX oxidase